MTAVGQDELAILLVKNPEEQIPPRDIFEHLQSLYEQAGRGSHISGQCRFILIGIWYFFRLYKPANYSIVKDSNAHLTVGNWNFKILP